MCNFKYEITTYLELCGKVNGPSSYDGDSVDKGRRYMASITDTGHNRLLLIAPVCTQIHTRFSTDLFTIMQFAYHSAMMRRQNSYRTPR